jgi:hypothetical protein
MYTHVVDDYTGREMSMSNVEDKTFYPTFRVGYDHSSEEGEGW